MLKDAIIDSAKLGGEGRTIYSETPLNTPAEEISGETERTLSLAIDDYGTLYYYRGNVTDNYVNFAGTCWRIVRIAGDESIKLILEDQNTTCESSNYTGNWSIGTGNFGYSENLDDLNLISNSKNNKKYEIKLLAPSIPDKQFYMNYLNSSNSSSMANNFQNFQSNKLNDYLNNLKNGDWCLNDVAYNDETGTTKLSNSDKYNYYNNNTSFYYDSYVRLKGKTTKEPTLKCNGTNMSKFANNINMYVGTLTVDEIVFAGGKFDYPNSNTNYYLINDYHQKNNLNFLSMTLVYFVYGSDVALYIDEYGGIRENGDDTYNFVSSVNNIRPAINLKSNIQITGGAGTKENPYEIAS